MSVTGTEGLTSLKEMSVSSSQTVWEGLGGAQPNVDNKTDIGFI